MVSTKCKICGEASESFATVASGKHCNLQLPAAAPDFDNPVEYYRCTSCNFIFTNFLDSYSPVELKSQIYNDNYVNFDPLYPEIRPKINARFLTALLQDCFPNGERPNVLDYGAGNGVLSALVGGGFTIMNYDALNPDFDVLPQDPIDVIFSAEVVEHMPFPKMFVADWSAALSEFGCVIFSTKLQPSDIDVVRGDWWYLGPRNGHVSLYSDKSLRKLCALADLHFQSLTEDWHIAYKNPGHLIDTAILQRNMRLLPTGFIMV
jgi:hypothetical protein